MMKNEELVAAYEQFLTLHDQLFKAGHHEVAFHALSAAVHCADDLRDGGEPVSNGA